MNNNNDNTKNNNFNDHDKTGGNFATDISLDDSFFSLFLGRIKIWNADFCKHLIQFAGIGL